MAKAKRILPDGSRIIFRPWFKLKSGRIIYAKTYGKKAFPILIREGQEPTLAF